MSSSKKTTKKISQVTKEKYEGPLVEDPHQVTHMFSVPKEMEAQEKYLFNITRLHNAIVELGNVVWFNVDEGLDKNKIYTDMQTLWKNTVAAVEKNQ